MKPAHYLFSCKQQLKLPLQKKVAWPEVAI